MGWMKSPWGASFSSVLRTKKNISQFSAVKVSLPILLFATMNALKFINESRTYLKIKKFKNKFPWRAPAFDLKKLIFYPANQS